MIGSFVGNLASGTSGSKMTEMTKSLSAATSQLSDAVNKIIPVVDTVDDNVKALTKKVNDINFSRDAIDINGMDELMVSMTGLVERVIGVDNKIDDFGKKMDEGHSKISTQISKIEFGKMDYFRTKDGLKLESFDPAKARRVLCMSRVGRVKCLPSVAAVMPIMTKGYIKECILYEQDLHCGVQKKLN